MGDPYLDSEHRVLRNLAGLTRARDLDYLERECTTAATNRLKRNPPDVTAFGSAEAMRVLHGAMFRDVFDWAGHFRTINIVKDGDMFLGNERLETTFAELDETLAGMDYFAGIEDERTFAKRMTIAWAGVNLAHPFREGNGRTTRLFLDSLAARNGRRLDWSAVGVEENIDVSRRSNAEDPYPMVDLLERITNRVPPHASAGDGAVTAERARELIDETNANNALESIPADAESDALHFDYLTGVFSEAEWWRAVQGKIARDIPGIPPEFLAGIGSPLC